MLKKLVVLAVIFILIAVIFSGYIGTGDRVSIKDDTPGSQGISWSDMVPLEKTTFVGYDPESYLDDYAYLAAVPASIFYSEQNRNLYSNPLLFYEAPFETTDDEQRVFNANQGIQYFMEDWLTYNEGEFENVQFINMADGDIEGAKAISNSRSYTTISGKTSAEVARNIALENWEYSDAAVVAVVEEDYPIGSELITGEITGTTPSASVEYGMFEGEAEPDPVNPIFHPFTIPEDYKYIDALMTWGKDYNPIKDITERGKDPDLQLYDDQLGEVAASEEWNVLSGASEHIGSYVYHSGPWRAAVTYMPTESLDPLEPEDSQEGYTVTPSAESGTRGSVELEGKDVSGPALPGPFSSTAEYTIEYTLYPGVDIPIPEDAPYGCRNAHFNLYWSDSSQNLGLIVRTSSGAEIATALDPGDTQSIELIELGEGAHSVAVVNLNDDAQPVDFKVEYIWEKTLDEKQCDGMASAAEGAIYASTQNIPLLYTSPRKVEGATIEALDTLGITKVYLINLDGHGKSSLSKDLESSRSLLQDNLEVEHITSYGKIYNMIRENTKHNGTYQNDVVFTTLNPWSYWYTFEGLKGEQPKGFYIGPATYAAAHHGSPVFITESDTRLSNAQGWHNEFWRSAWDGRYPPSVGCMVLTARDVYAFLDEYGFDYKDVQESILTVAGQFDIGTTWDRMLVGAATSGRIQGSPVDTAYWIARSMFYQSIIFSNPAVSPELDENDGKRITGSRSVRVAGALRITQDEMEVEVQYPVAQTWVSYDHRFNERGAKYWGAEYVTATGITPFYDVSDNPSMDIGGVWPDLTTSEIVPHYLDQAGYSSVFTTNFATTMDNLNRGAIMWLEVMHGGNRNSGIVGFWDENQPEPNPWRGYEENAFTLRGSTADPDVVSMNKKIGLDLQPGGSPIISGGPRRESHDGVVIAIAQQAQTVSFDGIDFDNALENVHSMGVNAGSCLIANSYLHLALIRHGSAFQVIDPWLTSWYSGFAIETFVRDIVLGYNIGQAYERGIKHVGIQYLTEHWWWDIFENVVYFGDPDLRVYSPEHEWERPKILKRTLAIEGHAPSYAAKHPYSIKSTTAQEAGLYAGAVIIPLAVIFVAIKRKKKVSSSLKNLKLSKN
jgi:hypothetical protein